MEGQGTPSVDDTVKGSSLSTVHLYRRITSVYKSFQLAKRVKEYHKKNEFLGDFDSVINPTDQER